MQACIEMDWLAWFRDGDTEDEVYEMERKLGSKAPEWVWESVRRTSSTSYGITKSSD